ncbi:MAG: sigma 54-interacting transcriptional regulator [Archangium sp.]|nr:sigma 54-interacting transcriptional regulator [Archangium sp.]
MPVLRWVGLKPEGPLQEGLVKAGWVVRPTGDAAVTVVQQAQLPGARDGAWLWVVPRPVSAEVLLAAVDRGAIDVIARGPGWEARVLARLEECLVVEPPVVAPANFVAESAAAKVLLRRIHQAAQTSMPVLLTGETGTGKELAARLVHQWSRRKSKTFVPINCAAIPNELMEGELFGYAKGAFSGAVREYPGLVAAAEGGTVLLDEIDDTPFALQVKLLRVLEDRTVSRLGESEWHQVDFRILAATNRDLRPLIDAGQFGADLYERLATLVVELPPLRDRLDDVPAMVLQLIERYYAEDRGASSRNRVRALTPEALEVLRRYRWPGNVRELRNVIYGALVTKKAGAELLVSDLPRRVRGDGLRVTSRTLVSSVEVERRVAQGDMNLRREVELLERMALSAALRRAGGNAAEAARLLGEVGRGKAKDPGGTVRTMMRRLGLNAAR